MSLFSLPELVSCENYIYNSEQKSSNLVKKKTKKF